MIENYYGFEDAVNGEIRFTCYKPNYSIDEWIDGEHIREWDIMRDKDSYFEFIDHINEIAQERKNLENKFLNILEKKKEELENTNEVTIVPRESLIVLQGIKNELEGIDE